jgi:hypothetical protein
MALMPTVRTAVRHRKLFRRHFVHVLNFQLRQLNLILHNQLLAGNRNNSNISRIVSWKTFWLLWTGCSGQVALDGCSGQVALDRLLWTGWAAWAGCSEQDIELVVLKYSN